MRGTRRRDLAAALALGLLLATIWTGADEPPEAEAQAAETVAGPLGELVPNPTGQPLGGGEGYTDLIALETAQYRVSDTASLLEALAQAEPGEVIYLEDNAEFDLTGHQRIVIPGGVTLAGGRGREGALGALIYTTDFNAFPLLQTGGPQVRLTGLRLQGPDPETAESAYERPNSRGVQADHPRLRVDNCELSGWSHSAVMVQAPQTHVHHCYIHHNRRTGLGYGVVLGRGEATALIEACVFEFNRHDIAASGTAGNYYEARYNLSRGGGTSHAFDMHPDRTEEEGPRIAGDGLFIHHNVFDVAPRRAIWIGATPVYGGHIRHNLFLSAHAAIHVAREGRGVHCVGNRFEAGVRTRYVFTGDGCTLEGVAMPAGSY